MRDFRAEIRAIILKKEKPEPVKKQGCWHTRYALRKSATGSRFAVTVNKVKGHPIGKAFQDLHKKYEPQLAAAFLNVVKKIKSEIDLKELAQHVQARNVHHVVQTVIGDKFNSNLKGKFKSLLFEAYHAGAFIGASQLKNAPIRKGGPGSGRYPAGSGEEGFWHGSPSGQFKEGPGGIHVGTKLAARQALEARIGVRADGKDWDGTQEYGKVLLAGHEHIRELRGPYSNSGYNAGSPKKDFYAKDHPDGFPVYGDRTRVSETSKPNLFPVKIVGSMTNGPETPRTDAQANGMIRRQFNQGKAINGYYYKNEGEDEGSISAVVPKASHLVRVDSLKKSLTASLDVTNQYAVDYLEDDLPTLIKEINTSQMEVIQQILLDGINNGEDGEEIASRIKNTIGLTQAQAQYVENFRTQIETGLDGSFTPIDERRLSVTQAQMAQDQFDSPDKDPAVVDALVENYAASLLAKRAMDISATEILNASREGQRNLWDDAVDQGYLDPAITRKHWLAVGDDRTREDHMEAMEANEPDGVAMDDLYDTPWGPSNGPGDGPDEEIINCRCVEFLSFTDQSGKEQTIEEDADAEAE